MRRRLAAVAALGLLLGAAPVSPGPRVPLEFWTIALQPLLTAYVQDMIGRYERAHPGVRVRWIDLQFQSLDQKLLSAIAGGVPPDVVNLNTEITIRMAQAHALVDMEAAVPAAARARYFPNIWASLRVEGRAYGIPWYVEPDVLAFNRTLFQRAGLDPAHPPATMDAFIQAAVTVKQKTGVYGFMPNVDTIRLLTLFQEEGLPVLSPDRRRAVFAGPAHAALLARYVDLFKRDMFPADTPPRVRTIALAGNPNCGKTTLFNALTGLRAKVGNYAGVTVERKEGRLLGAPGDLNARVLDLPTMDLVVPLASRHPVEAVDLALFVTNDENQFGFSHVVAAFPSTVTAAADPYFTRGGTTPEARGRAIAAAELGIARDLTVVTPRSDELLRIFREAVENAFFGRMTPQQALSWAAAEWNRRL